MKHLKFIARTVLVENNQLERSLATLNKILSKEKVIETSKRYERCERPYERRNRMSFEKCMEIYSGEIDRKIRFVVRKNRENPFPWD
jgi:small subunit ribosomal protein S21